jgi:hypothetical protein
MRQRKNDCMRQRRNDCRDLLSSVVSRRLLLTTSVSERAKYFVTDILIDASSRSLQEQIGQELA